MTDKQTEKLSQSEILQMTADIVAAYVSNNMLPAVQISDVISAVYTTFVGIDAKKTEAPAEIQKPAVSIKKSVTPDYLICLEDGKKLKMLKRHLRTTYNMSPDEYRTKWGLSADYPMVAPNYANARSEFAKKIGLGMNRNILIRRGRKAKKA